MDGKFKHPVLRSRAIFLRRVSTLVLPVSHFVSFFSPDLVKIISHVRPLIDENCTRGEFLLLYQRSFFSCLKFRDEKLRERTRSIIRTVKKH